MKKLLLICSIVFFGFTQVFGQYTVGVRGGLNFATFGGADKEMWGGTDSNPNMLVKFHIGGYLDYPITGVISIQPGLFYSAKGPKYEGTIEVYDNSTGEFTNETVSYKKKLNYLDLPILVTYKITPQVSVFAGPQFSFLLSAKVKIDAPDEIMDYLEIGDTDDVKDSYKGFDMAIPIGINYGFANGINAQISYDIGLLKTAEGYVYDGGGSDGEGSVKVRNNVIKLSIGYPIRSLSRAE